MREVWGYDIFCDEIGICVGDSGDLEFDTMMEALADAHDYIISELSKEYERDASYFYIDCYSREVADEDI